MSTFIKKEKDTNIGNTSQASTDEPRRSKRQRVAPKTYDEEALAGQSKAKSKRPGRGAQWKEEELEKLLNCIKKFQRADNVQSVKKHVKTKNYDQVEAKLESLKKKALERAMDETVGMPPLQCWEMLAKDVTNTLNDESYKELSKVFSSATSETSSTPGRAGGSSVPDPNQPNYNEIYKFLAALLRGSQPPQLSPIDSMVVLECLNNTVEFLQHLQMKDQSTFLQKRYQELFLSLYSSDETAKSQKRKTGARSSSRGDHSYTDKEECEEEPIGLGTLNPFNIPVDRLNLIRPPPCQEHGNMYCWLPGCKERQRKQPSHSTPSS